MAVADELVKATKGVQEEAGCSEADASEAHKGNTDFPHIAEIVNIESSTFSDTRLTLASLSTSSSTSSDMDDIPLNRVYENLNKGYPHHHPPKLIKSQIVIPLFPCILLLKKGYMTCNKEGSMHV